MSISITSKRLTGLGLAAALSVGGAIALPASAQAAATFTWSGYVTDNDTGAPLQGYTVNAFDLGPSAPVSAPTTPTTTTQTDGSGYYSFTLTAGDAYEFEVPTQHGSTDAWLGGAGSGPSYSQAYASSPAPGADLSNEGFQVSNDTQWVTVGGSVSAADGTALADGDFDVQGNAVRAFQTSGTNATTWSAQVLVGTTFTVLAEDWDDAATHSVPYANQYYGGANDQSLATTIIAGPNETNLNISLAKSAKVSGAVTGDGTHSIANVSADLIDPEGRTVDGAAVSGTDGTFAISNNVGPGTYKLRFDDNNGYYGTTWYGGTSEATASPITITSAQTVQLTGFTRLVAAGSISGKLSGAVPTDTTIVAYSANGDETIQQFAWNVGTDGSYTVVDLPAGTYKLRAGYVWLGGTSFETASSVTVAAGAVTANQNFVMPATGRITFTVRADQGAAAVRDGAIVSIVNASTGTVLGWQTLELAAPFNLPIQVLTDVPVGSYKLTFSDPEGVYAPLTTSTFAVTANGSTSLGTVQLLKVLTNTAAPKVSGTAAVGKTLTVSPGTWSAAATPTYQWLRAGKAIAGATKASYKLVAADAGKAISVKVTAAPQYFQSVSVTTAATKAVSTTSKTKVSAKALGGGKVSVSVTVTGNGVTATGSVKISYGRKSVTVKLSKTAKATATIRGLTKGSRISFTAAYQGTAVVGKSSAAASVTVK